MSQMLPEGGEVMRRAACGDVSPAPPPPTSPAHVRSENKELLRQQLLSASKERLDRTDTAAKQKHARSRQKNRWKLKFHHQALPQEYLDHYERSLQRAAPKSSPAPAPSPPSPPRSAPAPAASPGEPPPEPALSDDTFRLWAQRLAALQPPADSRPPAGDKPAGGDGRRPRVVSYEDLPYMGEMTLNDSKPRRGRKPKKADICHLIYENYGTVVPGQPPRSAPAPRAARSDLQHRIISNLLERRRARPPAAPPRPPVPPPARLEEPLNLCVRDLTELKLQPSPSSSPPPTPVMSPPAPDAPSSPAEQPNAISVIQRNTSGPWAGGVVLHPLALHSQLLYYGRLAAQSAPPAPDPSTKLVLKRISELLDPALVPGGAPPPAAPPAPPSPAPSPAAPSPPPASPSPRPAKRKRSAIFIPPMAARGSSAAPTAEVSICKFKFTGGSKPSLQEKKMLSVDAGGNFRYYSGTGGKGAKGYSYLQREGGGTPAPAPTPPPPDPKRKRKSRKSLQREKLEQTFKEKGFLIQTQQLQSAEGATYCKFRQLRKFTRYLFRSWKDYLPGAEGAEPAPPPDGAPPADEPAAWD